jgi:hypothetical protein
MGASFVQILSRKTLYRRKAMCATALLLAFMCALSAYGQSYKKRSGPRAIAVIRWDADVKDKAIPKLIPVTILDEGQFYDASVYKAAPAPMPLLFGTVYEAQDKGELLGYFTIKSQLRWNGKENWFALGDWQSASPPMERLADDRKSSVEVVRGKPAEQTGSNPGDDNDDRDLNKKKTTVYDENGKPMPEGTQASPAAPMGEAGDTHPQVKKGSSSSDSNKSGDKTTGQKNADDPDRPTIKRQASSPGPNGSAPSTTSSTTNAPATSAPQAAKTSTPEAAAKPPSAADDPDRPKLKRGKPSDLPQAVLTEKGNDPDRPTMRRAVKDKQAKQEGIPIPPRVLDRGPLLGENNEQTPVLYRTRTYESVAVSDATPEQPNTFRYKMPESQKEELQAKLDALAQGEVDTYLRSIGRAKEGASLQKSAPKAGARKRIPAPKPEDRKSEFTETQFEVLDLNHRNDPILVFSGRERTATPTGATAGATQDVYVTYVARVGYEGNPQGIFRSVTVNDRLDVSPKLELIDAVDADGDGIGELLFRRVADDGAVFALYRVSFDRMTELFHGGTAD